MLKAQPNRNILFNSNAHERANCNNYYWSEEKVGINYKINRHQCLSKLNEISCSMWWTWNKNF